MEKYSGRLPVYLVSLAAIFIVLGGIRATAPILNPILLAMIITIVVLPIPGRLTKRGMPGWLALVLTILVVVLALALVIATVFFSVTKLAVELPAYLNDAAATTSSSAFFRDHGRGGVRIHHRIPDRGRAAGSGRDCDGSGVAGPVRDGSLHLLLHDQRGDLTPGAARLGLDPGASAIRRVSALTGDIRHYMTMLTGINFLVAVGDTVFLMVLGVDYALLWGLLAWFMGYIPSIGFLIALIPPFLMAYAQYGLGTALLVLLGYVLINGGVQNFIQPKMMGQGLKINPLVVFVGLFVWGFLLGGIGAILAVPLTVLVLTLMENFDATRAAAVLMRYTGEHKKEERQQAMEQAKGWLAEAKTALVLEEEPEEQG